MKGGADAPPNQLMTTTIQNNVFAASMKGGADAPPNLGDLNHV